MDEIRCSIEVREDEGRLGFPLGGSLATSMTYGERPSDRAEIFEPGSL